MKIAIEKPKRVPAGSYEAEFVSMEERPGNPEYGGGVYYLWTWLVTDGPWKGQKVTTLSSSTVSPKSKAGLLLAGMAGASFDDLDGDEIDTDNFVGNVYRIVVEQKGEWPVVASAQPLDD